MTEETLFSKLGGQAKVDRIVDSVLDKVTTDPRLRNRFAGVDLVHLREQVKLCLSNLCRNEPLPSDIDLATVHQGLGVTSEEFDLVVGFFDKFTWEVGCSQEESSQVAALVNSLRDSVIRK
jgi:truncated hemoglobin YjbI